MLKPNISPKSPRIESSIPTIRLPNGNVKFSHTNRKSFTVGDAMTFHIVKMENKNPRNLLPLARGGPHLIQQCLGPPHAPTQTAGPTAEALSHTYAVKSPLVTMARPKCAPKSTPSRGPIPKPHYLPHPWTRLTKRHPDAISAVFTQCTGQTDRPIDRSFTGKFDDYRPLRQRCDLIIIQHMYSALKSEDAGAPVASDYDCLNN